MLESSFNPDGGDTRCDFVSQLFPWLCLSAMAFLTEVQLVARKHLNAVYPLLDIRYCGVLPIHTRQTNS